MKEYHFFLEKHVHVKTKNNITRSDQIEIENNLLLPSNNNCFNNNFEQKNFKNKCKDLIKRYIKF